MTKLWGKVWPIYHFTPTQYKLRMHGCILTKQVKLNTLEWNDVGVKLCLTTLTWMIGFRWNENKLSIGYHSLQQWSHFRFYLVSCYIYSSISNAYSSIHLKSEEVKSPGIVITYWKSGVKIIAGKGEAMLPTTVISWVLVAQLVLRRCHEPWQVGWLS